METLDGLWDDDTGKVESFTGASSTDENNEDDSRESGYMSVRLDQALENEDSDDYDSHEDDVDGGLENLDNYVKNSAATALNHYLAQHNIDPNGVLREDEYGRIVKVPFNQLPQDEQINIIRNAALLEYGDDELDFIHSLRENNMTVDDFINQRNINQSTESLEIDTYTDAEVYLQDLADQYPDFTDAQLEQELRRALEDETTFKIKADRIRERYRNAEIDERTAAYEQQFRQQEENYNKVVDEVIDVANSYEDFEGIEFDREEKKDILNYALFKDETGSSQFIKDMSDPRRLFEAALFARKGREIITNLHHYYQEEIRRAVTETENRILGNSSQSSYQRPQSYRKPQQNSNTPVRHTKGPTTIDELFS